jgi:hypothetical protein
MALNPKPTLGGETVTRMVVSRESLRNAEKAVEDLQKLLREASPADKPALQGRLDVAIRHYELIRKCRILGT